MKKILMVILTIGFGLIMAAEASAGWINGHYRQNGTYVKPYTRSNPNSTVTDNYSYKGNWNPFTGKQGSNYFRSSPSSPYFNGSSRRKW
jgi:hypothetical protein